MDVDEAKALVLSEWTNNATVEAWTKWHPKIKIQQQVFADEMSRIIGIKAGMQILDLASGTGEPAISFARKVGASGQVIASDLSQGMLAAAAKNATQAGLNNMAFRQVDAHELPFEDASFDVVTSRLGVMYFSDSQRAFAEIRRVLKPGGRFIFAAWGPVELSPYFLSTIVPFVKRANLPPPPPGMPQPLRYAIPSTLAGELRLAGFSQVNEDVRVIDLTWPGTPAELFQHLYDVAVPMRPLFDGLAPDVFQAARDEVDSALAPCFDGDNTVTPAAILFAWGIR